MKHLWSWFSPTVSPTRRPIPPECIPTGMTSWEHEMALAAGDDMEILRTIRRIQLDLGNLEEGIRCRLAKLR